MTQQINHRPGHPVTVTGPRVHDALKEYFSHQRSAVAIARKYNMSRRTLYRKIKHVMPRCLSPHANRQLLNKYTIRMIYDGGRVFGDLHTSLPKARKIFLNQIVPLNMVSSDVDTIFELKDGFNYIKRYRRPLTLHTVKRINSIVAHDSIIPGFFANHAMKIREVNYTPPRPSAKTARKVMDKYLYDEPSVTNVIHFMLQFMRHRFFWCGNEVTAWLAANYYMLRNGLGILDIPADEQKKWDELLSHFYRTGDMTEITQWLKGRCVFKE